MDAYSEDLRQRVVQACDEGVLTRQEIAEQFHVSTAWIRRLLQRRRETGSISALPGGRGPQRKLTDLHLTRLTQLVEKRPAATLAELRKSARLRCSLATIHRALKSLGLSFKKSHCEPVSRIGKTSNAHASLGPIA